MTPALEVCDLAYTYPDGHRTLDGISFRVEPGERVALLGANGAGKTTLILHFNGVHTATEGEVRIGGIRLDRSSVRDVRRRVGIVFQDPDDQLFSPTVYDDVAFGPANQGLRGAQLDARVRSALAATGMSDVAERAPHHLSFGQRRRVAVATVLAMEPEILVLDEPTSNLDPVSRRELTEVLAPLDLTVVVVTHDLLYALELCPRALVVGGGRIVADGPTAEVLADDQLMTANRLELPFGFDRARLATVPRQSTREGDHGRTVDRPA